MSFFRWLQGQFSRGHALPRDIVPMMERFGRFEWDPEGSGESVGDVWWQLQAPLRPFATEDPEGFLVALAAAVLPVGGWAVYGASRTTFEFVSSLEQHPTYKTILSAAVEFLRSNGVPPMRVRGYEWAHWIASGGDNTTWLPRRPIPSLGEAPITDLRSGEVRRVVQITPQPDSNVILVQQQDDGRYCAVIDARQSDEDPRRTQREWKFAASLRELYVEIGLSMQTPTYWYDAELEPYFPLPRPRI